MKVVSCDVQIRYIPRKAIAPPALMIATSGNAAPRPNRSAATPNSKGPIAPPSDPAVNIIPKRLPLNLRSEYWDVIAFIAGKAAHIATPRRKNHANNTSNLKKT